MELSKNCDYFLDYIWDASQAAERLKTEDLKK